MQVSPLAGKLAEPALLVNVPALLAAEITARMGRDPGEIYQEMMREFGEPVYERRRHWRLLNKSRCWQNSHRSRSSLQQARRR